MSHLPHGPTLYLQISDLVLRGDVSTDGTVLERAPNLVFENLNQRVGRRLQRILAHLFPRPAEDSNRLVSFVNRSDTILFRNF